MTDNFLRPYSLEHIIKLWVDECTGRFIDPMTVTDAVITKHGKTLTEVLDLIFGNLKQNKDLLNALKLRVEDLETYKSKFDTLKIAFDTLKDLMNQYAKTSDLNNLRTELMAVLESVKTQLQNNTNLFTQLLTLLVNNQPGLGGTIDIGDLSGYLKTADLLGAIRALNTFIEKDNLLTEIRALDKFTEKVKSEMTGDTYESSNGLVTLPPTIGGSLYIGDTANSLYRFYYTLKGDVNGDGAVTAADITALYAFLLNNDASQLVNPDVNNDGLITAGDITAVYDVLLGGRNNVVHDRVTEKNYILPEGTIFINGKYVYYVKADGSSKSIGTIYDPNHNFYVNYTLPNNNNNSNGPENPDLEDVPAQMETEKYEAAVEDTVTTLDNDKLINLFIVALLTKLAGASTMERIDEIKESIAQSEFDESISDYSEEAIKVEWEGLPQEYALGLVYLKDGNVQYVQPLGSFIDFKRFTSDLNTSYVDIAIFNDLNKFNSNLTRFNIITLASLSINGLTLDQDTTIIGEYTPQSGTEYYFLFDGLSTKKPVVFPKSYLMTYLSENNYV